jgi:hypothetical protein
MNPTTAVSGVVAFVGLASFGVLAWAWRRVILLDRAVDAGDVVVLGVFAVFGAFCLSVGWLLFRHRADAEWTREAGAAQAGSAAGVGGTRPPRRVTASQGCATAGVLLLMLSVLLPERWYPVVLLFGGLALLAVSHVLTPCEERLAKLRRARASLRQL